MSVEISSRIRTDVQEKDEPKIKSYVDNLLQKNEKAGVNKILTAYAQSITDHFDAMR
jgi:hypothetical protein